MHAPGQPTNGGGGGGDRSNTTHQMSRILYNTTH